MLFIICSAGLSLEVSLAMPITRNSLKPKPDDSESSLSQLYWFLQSSLEQMFQTTPVTVSALIRRHCCCCLISQSGRDPSNDVQDLFLLIARTHYIDCKTDRRRGFSRVGNERGSIHSLLPPPSPPAPHPGHQ